MQQLTPDQRQQLADVLMHLYGLNEDIADTNDIADMLTAYMKRRDWAYCTDDYDRIFQCADEVCLHKLTRSRVYEAIENWIHYKSPQQREEICTPQSEY